jgi:quercetin dioxygenase-like cupin family protein
MSVKHMQDLPLEPISAGEKTSKQVLISHEEGPHFAMRRFVIEPGGFMPLHSNSVEHEQFCIGGEAEVVIGEETVRVKKNDVVFIPANVPHSYRTTSNEAFEFLCLIPNLEDIIEIKE